MQIPFPSKGLSDMDAASRQIPLTTTFGQNVAGVDPSSKRLRGAQRSGMLAWGSGTVGGGTKIRLLVDLVYDARVTTYTALGDSMTTDWSKSTPSTNDVLGVVTDELGNVYFLDDTAVVKNNADGTQVWKIALPAKDPRSVIRALWVDEEGRIFAGVSSGGDMAKACVWAYEQLENNKTQLLWEMTPGWFTESLKVSGLTLYAAQNDTTNWRSRMALYTNIGVPEPTLTREWPVVYPTNDADVSEKDGSVATTHEPLANRGFSPKSPETTAPWSDWTILDLPNVSRRLWTWLDSEDVDGDGSNNANKDDGAEITTWVDKSGNGRNAYAVGTGPTLRKGVLAGKDTLFFDGTSNAMVGEAALSTAFQYRQLNRSLFPTYAKAQSVWFILCRTPQSNTRSTLVAQNYTTASNVKDRRIQVNASFFTTTFQNANGSTLLYEEVPPVAGPAVGAWGRVTASGNNVPLGGAFDADGLVLHTYVFDHGYDDTTPATRSCHRINGRPVDRWTSGTGYETLTPGSLGADVFSGVASNFFQGDILKVVVLSDWYETSTGSTTAYTQQKLIEMPLYPDSVWSAGSTTEIEKIEGWLMHGGGAAHKLPSGYQGTLEAVGVVNNNDTVTIDAVTYTFKTTLTPAANEVLRDTVTGTASLRNLHHAINGTGAKGTAYASATTPHATVWSPGVLENDGTNARSALMVQAREARGSSYTLGENTAEARLAWIPLAGAATTASVRSRTASATEPGIYPHPYFLYRTADSTGGPPSTTASASLASGLSSPYGILAVWDPSNGKLKKVLTTNGPGLSGLPFGGVGYGVRYGTNGDIFCAGPRQAAVTIIGVSAENVDLRKFFDTAAVWDASNTSNGATATTCWTAGPGAFTYHYPRMALDKWDNLYVPISASGISAKVYRRIAPSSAQDSALIYSLTSLTDDPAGYAIAVDPRWPDFASSFTLPRAERFFLGTVKASSSNTVSLYAMREISVAGANVSPRTSEVVAVVGAGLYKVSPSAVTTIDASAFDATARFIDSASLGGVRFFTDGTRYYVYDPRNSINGGYRARSSGQIPPRGMLMERFGSRIVIAGFADRRAGLAMSRYGDPYDWDFDPPGDSPLTIAAISSELSNLGDFPDVVTCLCSFRDDLALVGGDHSLSMLRGDPAQGGRFDEVVKGIGVAFGRARCFTPDGVFWWLTNQAELYRMPIGGSPEMVSRHVQRRLSNSIDFSAARVEMSYDPNERCIRIVQVPHGTPSTLFTHWRYELETGALWIDNYGNANVQPCAVFTIDGDGPNDRVTLAGGGDGKVRKFSGTATDDDGERIGSFVRMHMPVDNERPGYMRFTGLQIVTAIDQYGAEWDFYTTEDPDDFGSASVSGTLQAGSNSISRVRSSGSFCALDIKGAGSPQRWALERITIDAKRIARSR